LFRSSHAFIPAKGIGDRVSVQGSEVWNMKSLASLEGGSRPAIDERFCSALSRSVRAL
jgi:hypothetical protein